MGSKRKEETKKAPSAKKVKVEKVESSSSESDSSSSDSSSSSEDEKPVAKKVATKKVAAKKDDSSSSSSSDSSDSSDSSEDEKPVAKKAKAVAAPVAVAAPEPAAATDSLAAKIFIKGLPWVCSEEEIREFFAQCGTIITADLPLNADGRSSGTAYVEFSNAAEAAKSLELDGSTWANTERWLKIEPAREKEFKNKAMGSGGVRPEGCDTIFIGNLPWDVTEEQLKELFSEAGEVNQVRFATGEDGGFRGFGHVQFTDGAATDAAVGFHGTDVNGRAIRVDYAPPRARPEGGGGGRGRGGGRGDGGRGRGGFDGGRGRGGSSFGGRGRGGAPAPVNKNKGTIVAAAGTKVTFD